MKIDGTPGNLNRNRQLLIAQTAWQGSDERQALWIMQCMPCGHMYGVDAPAFFQRKCPACQGGPPGLVVKPDAPANPPESPS